MNTDLSTIGGRIRDVRVRNGLNQEDFGQSLGFSQTAVSEFERNLKLPGGDFFLSLKRVYGESLDWIAAGEVPMLFEGMRIDPAKLANPSQRDEIERQIEEAKGRMEVYRVEDLPSYGKVAEAMPDVSKTDTSGVDIFTGDLRAEVARLRQEVRELQRDRDRLAGQVELYERLMSGFELKPKVP